MFSLASSRSPQPTEEAVPATAPIGESTTAKPCRLLSSIIPADELDTDVERDVDDPDYTPSKDRQAKDGSWSSLRMNLRMRDLVFI